MPDTTDELLAQFRAYLDGSGSEADSFLAPVGWSMARRDLQPRAVPCVRFLDSIAKNTPEGARDLAAHLSRHADDFAWGQTYSAADFGDAFLQNYGWLEVFGTRGHFVNDQIAAGFLILGPHVDYPDHHHIAEELYIPMTGGTEWRKGDDALAVRPAGAVIHHPSNVSHAMRTGDEPLLAIYLWRGGPLAQKSVIGAAVGGR